MTFGIHHAQLTPARDQVLEAADGIPISPWDRFEFLHPFGNRVEMLGRPR